jgi:hypothetical protein
MVLRWGPLLRWCSTCMISWMGPKSVPRRGVVRNWRMGCYCRRHVCAPCSVIRNIFLFVPHRLCRTQCIWVCRRVMMRTCRGSGSSVWVDFGWYCWSGMLFVCQCAWICWLWGVSPSPHMWMWPIFVLGIVSLVVSSVWFAVCVMWWGRSYCA